MTLSANDRAILRAGWTLERIHERCQPIPECGCMIWMGKHLVSGYGVISPGPRETRRQVYVHRMAYAFAHGKQISELTGLVVRHRCDVPACCNPDHLQLGTDADNTRDCIKRWRHTNAFRDGRFCKRGHDTTVTGVRENGIQRDGYNSRQCAECQRINSRERRRKLLHREITQ